MIREFIFHIIISVRARYRALKIDKIEVFLKNVVFVSFSSKLYSVGKVTSRYNVMVN